MAEGPTPSRADPAAARPRVELLAELPDITVTRHVCHAGPRDRPFPEQHRQASLAFVLAGSFCYRCRDRTHALVAGSVLLGEVDEAFVCSHEHGVGDVCLSLALSESLLAAAASAHAAPGRLFAAPALAPRPRISALARALAAATDSRDRTRAPEIEALALALTAEVLGELSLQTGSPRSPRPGASASDRERAVAGARFIAERATEPLLLRDVAGHVGLSPFHFLRLFRAVFGVTPHQYLVRTRVERAAARLCESEVPVTELAFEVGFGDLSNFVRTFHRLVGLSPGRWRQRHHIRKIRQV
ncbi:AraC-type DNA-binding protein [Nannocystis exedens]|uniref:AraC-type DNA-binding protein n=1 Tax=Nannocystis exedens TaxID=54 RepID=A0A1I2EZS7_9BACT|nr:AraC family transcriptional regulator [Nannocystis exedens]PCC69579.1 transcriptional regulator [Nannocystis exedens]SFE98674.1 AraC-type DNA-binding protein [Nannocystis exedens]